MFYSLVLLEILPSIQFNCNSIISCINSAHTATTIPTQSTSTPTSSPTCQALEALQASAQSLSCNRNDQCDTVHCRITDSTFQLFVSAANLTLLPCNQPPGVRLSINNPSGGVVVDRVITKSENISLPQELTLTLWTSSSMQLDLRSASMLH